MDISITYKGYYITVDIDENGHTYCYVIEKEDNGDYEYISGCGGFRSEQKAIKEAIKEINEDILNI